MSTEDKSTRRDLLKRALIVLGVGVVAQPNGGVSGSAFADAASPNFDKASPNFAKAAKSGSKPYKQQAAKLSAKHGGATGFSTGGGTKNIKTVTSGSSGTGGAGKATGTAKTPP